MILDPISNYVSPQFHTVHDDDFTSVLRERVDILPPDWDQLFKTNDKVPDDVLVNTPLTATMKNEGDRVVKVKVRFDEETVIRPSSDSSSVQNNSVLNENHSLPPNKNLISIDLNDDSHNIFNDEYDDDSKTNDVIISEPKSVRTTRTGRRMHVP